MFHKLREHEKERDKVTMVYCGKDDDYSKLDEKENDLIYVLDRDMYLQVNKDLSFCFKNKALFA